MPETINWSVTFDALLGPRVAESGTSSVTAYDKISVRLEQNVSDVDVDVQPSTTAGEVQLLVVKADAYDGGITYSADKGTKTFPLDGPLVLIGSGAVSLLASAPQSLRFSNPAAQPVNVEILVGRQT